MHLENAHKTLMMEPPHRLVMNSFKYDQAVLSLHLLGPFHISLNHKPISRFTSEKIRGLLAFLGDFSISDSLAFKEWSIVQRESLRQELARSQRCLISYFEKRGVSSAQALMPAN